MSLTDLPADLLAARNTPAAHAWKKNLKDREWRLDNLYFIRNDDGQKLKFKRNEAQRAFMKGMALRNVLPKARKLGFSTLIGILILDECLFAGGTVAGIVDLTLDDAIDKLNIIRFAHKHLPEPLRAANKLVRENEEYIEFANGSNVSVGTSYRGGTPKLLHISEYGKVSVEKPDAAREIKTGAIQAVPITGRIWVESTAHGTAGEFRDMVKRAEDMALTKRPMTALDYKLQFFGWWIKSEYRLPNNQVVVSAETKKYLSGVEAKIGRRIDADQAAWYQKKIEELGPDDIKEEFPSTIDELFYVSLAGAFWREEISRARREERIGQMVPHDPTRPVNTFWDIGEDCTSVIFHQTDGVRHRVIDFWEEVGASLQVAAGMIQDKRRDRGFVYGTHYGPHDLDERDWAHESKTRKQTAKEFKIDFFVVPRVIVKGDSIDAARRLLNLAWFDQEHCAALISRLENYRKKWNKLLGQFTSEPLHDINSHAADSWQCGAMGLRPERVAKEDRHGRRDRPKKTGWAS